MWTSFAAILLSVAFESSIARLPPPININQLEYAAGREADFDVGMRKEDIPLSCGSMKHLDCNDWENNYVLIETPGYPNKYQNKDQCRWDLWIPKETGTWIYCEEFSLTKGDYFFVGQQRYYGQKSWASIEPPQTSEEQNLVLKFKANKRRRNNGFKCWVTCWPTDLSQTPSYETTTTTTTTTTTGLPATANGRNLLLLLLTGNGDISNSEQCLESGSWCWDPITYSSIGNCCDSYCNIENPMEWGYCAYPAWYTSSTKTTSTTTSTTTITTTTTTTTTFTTTTTTTTTTTSAVFHV